MTVFSTLLKKHYLYMIAMHDPRLNANDFTVLAKLLSHRNDKTGKCFVAQETIAATIGMGEQTVRRSIKKLKELGWLLVTHKFKKTNQYEFPWDRATKEAYDECLKSSHLSKSHLSPVTTSPITHDSWSPITGDSLTNEKELVKELMKDKSTSGGKDLSNSFSHLKANNRSKNPFPQEDKISYTPEDDVPVQTNLDKVPSNLVDNNLSPTTKEEPMVPEVISDTDNYFNEFWSVYPRKVAKKRARAVFDDKVADGHSPEEIIAGARRYAAQMAAEQQPQRFVKYPEFWLAAERWEDEIIDPRLDQLKTSEHPITDMLKQSIRENGLKFLNPPTPPKTRMLQ